VILERIVLEVLPGPRRAGAACPTLLGQ